MVSVKVTLIRPPVILPIGSVTAQQGVPPLGLAYLGSYLRTNGHRVAYIDSLGEKINSFTKSPVTGLLINGLRSEEIIERIPKDSEIIGLSCMFSNEWFYVEKLISDIKCRFPNIPVVIGGEHVTADYQHILQTNPNVNFAIIGEGEHKLLDLTDCIESGIEKEKIPGIAFFDFDSKCLKDNSNLNRIAKINSIPWPDWIGIPLEKYLDLGLGMAVQKKRTLPMLASRGCPYKCTFCSSPQMWTTEWKARDINDVLNEIQHFKRIYAIEHIEFYDLTAIVNKNWIIDFCTQLIEKEIGITWSLPSGTRSEALTYEVLRILRQSGCLKLTYAPETGSSDMLKKIKKKVNLKKMIRSIKNAVKCDIIVKINMIFGFPDQRKTDLLFDFLFIFKLALIGVHDITCFAFSPYPGSELFNRLLLEGKLSRDSSYNLFLSSNVYNNPLNMKSWSEHIPSTFLPFITLGGMAFFYSIQFLIRPWRLYYLLKNLITNHPSTMLDLALNNLKNDFFKGRKLKIEN